MSKYFSFLRKKRSPSLRDEDTESFSSKLKRKDATKASSTPSSQSSVSSTTLHNIDEGRHSIHSIDYYDELKRGSISDPFQSDNDSLLDNISFGEGGEEERKVGSKSSSSLNEEDSEPTEFFVKDVVFETIGDIRSQYPEEDEGHVVDEEDNDDMIDDFMDEALDDLESDEERLPTLREISSEHAEEDDFHRQTKGRERSVSTDTRSIESAEVEGIGETTHHDTERRRGGKIVDRDKGKVREQMLEYQEGTLEKASVEALIVEDSDKTLILVNVNDAKDFVKDDLESFKPLCMDSNSSSNDAVSLDPSAKDDAVDRSNCVQEEQTPQEVGSEDVPFNDAVEINARDDDSIDMSREGYCEYEESESLLNVSSLEKEIAIEANEAPSHIDLNYSESDLPEEKVPNSKNGAADSVKSGANELEEMPNKVTEPQNGVSGELNFDPMNVDQETIEKITDENIVNFSTHRPSNGNDVGSFMDEDEIDFRSQFSDEIDLFPQSNQVNSQRVSPDGYIETINDETLQIYETSPEGEISKVSDVAVPPVNEDLENNRCLELEQQEESLSYTSGLQEFGESTTHTTRRSVSKSSSSCPSEIDEDEFDSAKEEFLSDLDDVRDDEIPVSDDKVEDLLDTSEGKTSYKSLSSEDEQPELPLEESNVIADSVDEASEPPREDEALVIVEVVSLDKDSPQVTTDDLKDIKLSVNDVDNYTKCSDDEQSEERIEGRQEDNQMSINDSVNVEDEQISPVRLGSREDSECAEESQETTHVGESLKDEQLVDETETSSQIQSCQHIVEDSCEAIESPPPQTISDDKQSLDVDLHISSSDDDIDTTRNVHLPDTTESVKSPPSEKPDHEVNNLGKETEVENRSEPTGKETETAPKGVVSGVLGNQTKTEDGAQETETKRTQSLTEEKFLLSAVNADHLEAEARLAQRRAARAEARELRLRELEKQQQEQETNEEEEQYAASNSTPPQEVPSRTPSATRTRSSVPTNSSISRRSSEDSIPDDHLPSSARELKAEFRELEERFRKAMVTNAQLDNEKATLTYEVEYLKDKYSELEETHVQLTKEHKKKCSENEQLRKLSNKLKDEVKIVRRVLQERDELIQEYGLVLIGEENGEDSYDDFEDAERIDDTVNDLSPRKIGVKKALLSQEASELLSKGAAKGSLDVRLRKYAEDKHELEDEVRRLKMELEEEQSRKRKENGLDYEKQKEASKSLNEYKFRVQKAEAEVSTLQANVARLESLVSRYKATAEELEKSEEELKSEKRRLQRELRDEKEKCDELESSKAYVKRQYEKLLHDRGRV